MSSSHIMKYLINIGSVNKLPQYYQDAYQDLYDNHNIKTIIFFDESKIEWDLQKDTEAWTIKTYTSTKDLTEQILHTPKKEIYYINTFDENSIEIKEKIKKEIWMITTKDALIFRNKDLQRKLLLAKYPETSIQYQVISDHTQFDHTNIPMPYIVKPTGGMQSAGVSLIRTKDDIETYKKNIQTIEQNLNKRNIQSTQYIIEEYIEWTMYTIDYFVDKEGNTTLSPLIKIELAKDYGVDDFANYSRIWWTIIQNDITTTELESFIAKHVDAFDIKDTFVHHEFKKTPQWKLKTIEINGRIGWYRVEMIKNLHNVNLLTLPHTKPHIEYNKSWATFLVYPEQEGVLKNFNQTVKDIYTKMSSLSRLRFLENKINKNVWLTKNWYTSLGTIVISNTNQDQFRKDLQTIKKHYKDIIMLDS